VEFGVLSLNNCLPLRRKCQDIVIIPYSASSKQDNKCIDNKYHHVVLKVNMSQVKEYKHHINFKTINALFYRTMGRMRGYMP